MVYVDDVAKLFFRLAIAEAIDHRAYLTGGYLVSYADPAALVRKYVADADITFDAAPDRGTEYGYGLSFNYEHSRTQQEFEFDLPPFAARVLDRMNGTRVMAGLPPLECT